MARVVVAALVVALGAAGFAGGLFSSPSAEPTVQEFLLDWQDHAYAAAAGLTTGRPSDVTAALRDAYTRLDAASFSLTMGAITQSGRTAEARFGASVDLGQNGAPWNYTGRFTLTQTPAGWKIEWSPAVINPGLRPGQHLAVVSGAPGRQPVLDESGRPLGTPSVAYEVGVRPDQLKDPSATAFGLGRVTGLPWTELLGWITTAPTSGFEELVVLQSPQYQAWHQRLASVPGLIVRRERLGLFTSIAPDIVGTVGTEVSSALRDQGIAYRPGATVGLTGLQHRYNSELAGTPSTQVVTENAAERRVSVLATWPGRRPAPVRTTLDSAVQRAALRGVAAASGSAAIVAVQASTGKILAVADRTARGMPVPHPLGGRYPPGGAFTIVSGEALLARGQELSTRIPCGQVNDVGGHNFRNVPRVPDLGRQPTFATDFAHSCATAFSGLSEGLTAGDLNTAAAQFKIGVPWDLLPLPVFSGSVHAGGGVSQVASDTIGEGSVQMSPLAMAMTAAQVSSGTWHSPSIVAGDPQRARQLPVSAASLTSLRVLMREAVRSGAAKRANLAGTPVSGQVGTAPYQVGKRQWWVSWFVGYRGDLAFAAMEISASPATSALVPARRFLAAAPDP